MTYYSLPRSVVRASRDELSWSLLQYVSGSVTKTSVVEFTSFLVFLTQLYNEKEPLPAPVKGTNMGVSARALAAAAAFVVVRCRADAEQVKKLTIREAFTRPKSFPISLYLPFV